MHALNREARKGRTILGSKTKDSLFMASSCTRIAGSWEDEAVRLQPACVHGQVLNLDIW